MGAYIDSKGRWVDDGNPVGSATTCVRCGNRTFIQSVSVDTCTTCGYYYNYWSNEGSDD